MNGLYGSSPLYGGSGGSSGKRGGFLSSSPRGGMHPGKCLVHVLVKERGTGAGLID
jgi:hypothetical protein